MSELEGADGVRTDPGSSTRELFGRLEQVFERLTGKRHDQFSDLDEFDDAIRAVGKEGLSAKRIEDFEKGISELQAFYDQNRTPTWTGAREAGGLKLVVGGSSRFQPTTLRAVKAMLMYADTILVPDPVLPWIEDERLEEKFRHVHLLKSIFVLLHLDPFLDDGGVQPAIVVFQSWERSLERRDEQTRASVSAWVARFFAGHLGRSFDRADEVARYAAESPEEFLRDVQARGLFVPQGRDVPGDLKEDIRKHLEEVSRFRTDEHIAKLTAGGDGPFVFRAICERVAPQFHLRENAAELHAEPMLWLPVQGHYFTLCAKVAEDEYTAAGRLTDEARSIVRALERPEFSWLGDCPSDVLKEARMTGEQAEFRRRLRDAVVSLAAANEGDLDTVVREVGTCIKSLVVEHAQRTRTLLEKHKAAHLKTAIEGWITVGAAFLPFLGTLGTVASGVQAARLIGRYATEKAAETSNRRRAARSMLGFLSSRGDERNT